MSNAFTSGFIYHLIHGDRVVYVGSTVTQGGVFTRAAQHTKDGKLFDSISSYSVNGDDVLEQETNDIMRLSPRYNKIISTSKNYIKKQTALDKVAKAIKGKSSTNKLNGCVYYDTRVVDRIISLIASMDV